VVQTTARVPATGARTHSNGSSNRSRDSSTGASDGASGALCYVSDTEPGLRRKRTRAGFEYLDADGRVVEDEATLARIRALAVPPAWEDVWICALPHGHLQATGRDARGRKQYRYHRGWRAMRDESKFGRMVAFGEALPRIRRRVDEAMRMRGLPRERVVATVVRLLDTTGVRVGNAEYARDNGSYGLTTLRNKHVETHAEHFVLTFRAKSGREHRVDVRDPRVARIVQKCRELPGYELFQYVDDDGARRTVDSADVNEFIRQAANREFTAKDFRTWWGTVLAAAALREAFREHGAPASDAEAKRRVTGAIEHVAGVLGNTVAVARKSYVHPAVVEAYLDGEVINGSPASKWLSAEERGALALLRQRQM